MLWNLAKDSSQMIKAEKRFSKERLFGDKESPKPSRGLAWRFRPIANSEA